MLLRLWFHECCRVFQDRLVNNEDRMWFDEKMRSKMADFGVKDNEVLGEGPLLYGDFMVPNTDNKIYEEILDQQKVNYTIIHVDITQSYIIFKWHKVNSFKRV